MPTQSNFARHTSAQDCENNDATDAQHKPEEASTRLRIPSNRMRRATEKESLRRAEAEEAAQRRHAKKAKQARKRIVYDDSSDNNAQDEDHVEDADESDSHETPAADYSFTDKAVVSKPAQLKVLAQRNNRVPQVQQPPRMSAQAYPGPALTHRGRSLEYTPARQRERSWAAASSDFDDDGIPPDYDVESETVAPPRRHERAPTQDTQEALPASCKRSRSRSSTPTEAPYMKAQKLNDNGGRPRASDYDDVTQEIIATAISVFRCKICTTAPFPDRSTELQLVQESWIEGYERNNLPPMELTPTLAKLIMSRVSHVRGELKTKVRPLVEIIYGFESGQGSKAIAYNRKRAEDLREGYNFVYKVSNVDQTLRKGLYHNKIIQKTVNAMWFSNRKDEGVRFQEFFDPFPVVGIALVLTAIQCGIDEWATGIRTDVQFTAADYHTVFAEHLKCLEAYDKHTRSHRLLDSLCIKLHDDGRIHAGAQSAGAESTIALSMDAFTAAIREFEDEVSEYSDVDE